MENGLRGEFARRPDTSLDGSAVHPFGPSAAGRDATVAVRRAKLFSKRFRNAADGSDRTYGRRGLRETERMAREEEKSFAVGQSFTPANNRNGVRGVGGKGGGGKRFKEFTSCTREPRD